MSDQQATRPSNRDTDVAHTVVPALDPANKPKARPWVAVFPNRNPDPSQMQRYGFKKGEVMQVAGNAGNFFAHDHWQIECESSAPESK